MESVSCPNMKQNIFWTKAKIEKYSRKNLSNSLIKPKLRSLDDVWKNLRIAFESVFFIETEEEEHRQYEIKVRKYYEFVWDNYHKAILLEILKNWKAQSQSNAARVKITNPSNSASNFVD